MDMCKGCGSNNVKPAQLKSTALQLDEANTLASIFFGSGWAEIKASVCVDCGLVGELRVDPRALKKADKP